MDLKIFLLILDLTISAGGVNPDSISTDQYPSLLLGKWEVRTYGYEFRADGVCALFNPDDASILKTGKWKFDGPRLLLDWSGANEQIMLIRFVSPDAWEWERSPKRVWEATRMGNENVLQNIATHAPNAEDAKKCEFYTKAILKIEDRNENALNSCYAPDFRKLIFLGIQSTDEDPLPFLNYDFVYETQDTNPNVLKIGPARIQGEQISVPVEMQHIGSKPFTKTWIFSRVNDRWMVMDIVTVGHEFKNGSLSDKLAKQFQK
jgi:hypothetical protein